MFATNQSLESLLHSANALCGSPLASGVGGQLGGLGGEGAQTQEPGTDQDMGNTPLRNLCFPGLFDLYRTYISNIQLGWDSSSFLWYDKDLQCKDQQGVGGDPWFLVEEVSIFVCSLQEVLGL